MKLFAVPRLYYKVCFLCIWMIQGCFECKEMCLICLLFKATFIVLNKVS